MSYRIGDAIIDPGDEWEGFVGVKHVLLTHGHFDHIYGINRVIEMNPKAKIYTNDFGKIMLMDPRKNFSKYQDMESVILDNPENIVFIEDQGEIEVGKNIRVKAIFTPGHSESCITWLTAEAIFTGDSYIPGLKVVTNLPGCDKQKAEESVNKILNHTKYFKIYPGHF